MNGIIYYSNTGQSKYIAEYFAKKLQYPLLDILELREYHYENVLLVFPVHCQNIPQRVKALLERLEVRYLTIVATYGKMWHGNALWEIQKRYGHTLVAGAYVPTKHTYLEERGFDEFDRLDILLQKIRHPKAIRVPRSFKNPCSNIFKGLRSRIGVKMIRTVECDGCGICESSCPCQAISKGKTNHRCIRCLRCVAGCPKAALQFRCRLPMKLYLQKRKTDKLVIYV